MDPITPVVEERRRLSLGWDDMMHRKMNRRPPTSLKEGSKACESGVVSEGVTEKRCSATQPNELYIKSPLGVQCSNEEEWWWWWMEARGGEIGHGWI